MAFLDQWQFYIVVSINSSPAVSDRRSRIKFRRLKKRN